MSFALPSWIDADARRTIVLLVVSAVGLIAGFALPAGVLPAWLDPSWIAILLCGVPIVKDAAIALVTRFDIKADVLVSLALIASVVIGEYFAAGEIAWIMTLGSLLEELTVGKAQAGIAELVKLSPTTACRVVNGKEETIAVKDIVVGDVLRVRPGSRIPVDGIILSGNTSVDQAVMTGESMPVDKGPGEEVISGTLNRFGAFDMRAVKVGEDSSVQRLVRLVQAADAGHARIVRIADRWASWIVAASLTTAIGTWLVTGEIVRAVTILVVFCPCALVLATPTAVVAGIANASRCGFLVRAGDALERLAIVQRIAFDKTGTLTEGKPEVSEVGACVPFTESEVFALAASAEVSSEHPLGKAIANGWKKKTNQSAAAPDSFVMVPGRGVKARVSGREVLVGNPTFLAENNVVVPQDLQQAAQTASANGETIAWVAVDGAAAGFVALADRLRRASLGLIHELAQSQVQSVLLTGDHHEAAQRVARKLGIDQVRAECLPKDKMEFLLAEEKAGAKTAMVGDGVNDAPALKRSFVGVAMGGIGSDIAVQAADIVAVGDRIERLPHLVRLSRRMMNMIRFNLTLAMSINFVAILLAMTGLMGPVMGALVHNAGSVLVIMLSASLLGYGRKELLQH